MPIFALIINVQYKWYKIISETFYITISKNRWHFL